MQLAFGWYNILELLFCLVALWMGIRDLQGKDPLIHTFFNQYDRDPEYRAMWQKKNGIWEIANGIAGCLCILLFHFPTIRSGILLAMVIIDAVYIIAYESWEHSND